MQVFYIFPSTEVNILLKFHPSALSILWIFILTYHLLPYIYFVYLCYDYFVVNVIIV